MKKAIIYGAGQVGIQTLWHIYGEYEILGFIDSDPRKWSINNQGRGIVFNGETYLIIPPPTT